MKLSYLFKDQIYHTRIKTLEDKSVIGIYYQTVSSGTSGKIKPPGKATLLRGYWPKKISVVVSGVGMDGKPDATRVFDATGKRVVAALDENGDYLLSSEPNAYPVALVYAYRCKFLDYDSDKDLFKSAG